jgi:hypothetical protein
MAHLGFCPTGKRIYWEERLANRAISKAQTRGELPQMRHYLCPHCDRWHLSRKRRHTRGPMRDFALRCLRCFCKWALFTDAPEPLIDKTCPFCGNLGAAVEVTPVEPETP